MKTSPVVFMSTLFVPLVLSNADKTSSLRNLRHVSINHSHAIVEPGSQLSRRDAVSFSAVGSGDCHDSNGKMYSYIKAPNSLVKLNIDCLSYCGQVNHPDLVGVSDGVGEASLPVVARTTRSPSKSPSTSPTAKYSKVGDGMCYDSNNNKYSRISSPLTTTADSACFDWCDQNDDVSLIGVAVRKSSETVKRCYCLFSGAIPGYLISTHTIQLVTKSRCFLAVVQFREQMELWMLFVTTKVFEKVVLLELYSCLTSV
jgi:hypothetical protein